MSKMTSDIISKDLIAMLGTKAVLHNDHDTAPFLSDWHSRYHGTAHAVALPENTDQVSSVLAYAEKHNIVVVPQGGNTGFMGGATPDASGNHSIITAPHE